MAGSSYGKIFTVTTWGESHGKSLGAVVDGVPSGVPLCEKDIQKFLDRRKPGQNQFTTARSEADQCEILSGVFEGVTTGTPIAVVVWNKDQHSKDYNNIKDVFRPGHADYTFHEKFEIRDYRGGGRSSGRETIGRVIGGAIAMKVLAEFGISFTTYVSAIGDYKVNPLKINTSTILDNPLFMPDKDCSEECIPYLEELRKKGDSIGSEVKCIAHNVPVGIGEPVFDKLDANLAKAVVSIGAVKAVEIGAGTLASKLKGSENNPSKENLGGTLGGISSGDEIIVTASFKPTPSIYQPQETTDINGNPVTINIEGRHDPIIGPRAAVVVESMCAMTILDLMMENMSSKISSMKKIY